MALTARLENPTPWDVKIDYDRGVKIRVPAFGSTDVGMQQMDDFRPNKPGSEAVIETLNYNGLFLLDSDRPYDNQALEALERSFEAKKAQYDAAVRSITDHRAAAGVAPNPEALEETLRMQGYVTLRNKIETLKNQISKLRKAIGPDRERSLRKQLDPARTVFVLDPPREFPSVASMNFFLDQNDEIRAKHEAYSSNMNNSDEAAVGGV